MNLATAVPVPSGVDLSQVLAAIASLSQRHEVLRTTYDHDDRAGTPVQIVQPEPPDSVEVVTCDADHAAELAATIGTWSQQRPHATTSPPWYATVPVVAGRPTHVLLVAHHILIDGLGLPLLTDELETLLRGDRIAQPPAQPVDVALAQRSPSWQPERQAAFDHWQDLLTQLALPAPPPDWASTPPDRSRWHQPTASSARAARSLHKLAAACHSRPHSVALAVVAVALWRVFGWRRPILSLMASNRWQSQELEQLICCNAQPIPLPVEIDPAGTFRELVTAVHTASLLAYEVGCYDLDDEHVVDGRSMKRRDVLFHRQFIFNYVGTANGGGGHIGLTEPDPPEVRWLPTRQCGPNGMLVSDDGATLGIWLRLDERLLPADGAAALAQTLVRVVGDLDPDSTLAAVAAHPNWSAVS